MNTADSLTHTNRRGFFKTTMLAGGGFFLGGWFPGNVAAQETTAAAFSPSVFIRITPQGVITLFSKTPEIGQGVKTTLPMILAEELEVDWEKVIVEQGEVDSRFGGQTAGGSNTIKNNYDQLRRMGAVAKTMLVTAAANTWQVPVEECTAASGVVSHGTSGRKLSYGELAETASKLHVPDEKSVTLKAPADFKILGRRIVGVDNEKIVKGEPLFGIDQRLPGMVYAVYVRCPVFTGKVKNVDLASVKKLPGIRDAFVIEGGDDHYGLVTGIAIIGDSTWSVFKAKKALKVTWDAGAHAGESSEEQQKKVLAAIKGKAAEEIRRDGEIKDFPKDSKTVDAIYHYPHLAHANLEPQNCTAVFKDGKLEMWAPSQSPGGGLNAVTQTLKIPRDSIKIHVTRIGGGFGRRLMNDYMVECAVIAQKLNGTPVKVTWDRQQDFQHDFYRAGGWHHLRGRVDDAGKIAAWANHFVTFGLNNEEKPGMAADLGKGELPAGFIPNYLLERTILPTNMPFGFWRAPGSCAIAWVYQSFIDELAYAAKQDPLKFRLDLLADQAKPANGKKPNNNRGGGYDRARMRKVLELAAEKADWGRKMPAGSGQGIAFHYSHSGYVAVVAEVTVDAKGALKVDRLVAGVDVGPILNLSGAENQVEGSMLDGLSAAWFQEVLLSEGSVKNIGFDQYPMLRMAQAPKVEAHFFESDSPPTGLGEPALPPTAPAVCNAIFAATGKRVRNLPFLKEKLTRA
ncbi:MAG: molybdopterin cofactor-binding domain-containing protein [Luteolibacter sp.]